jgi:hypothetical protein
MQIALVVIGTGVVLSFFPELWLVTIGLLGLGFVLIYSEEKK